MDYLAEIAGSADVEEALDRLKGLKEFPDHKFPSHMIDDADVAGLRDSYPAIWRSELTNWLYLHPSFAAILWSELRYGHSHRERVAREAVRMALEQGLLFGRPLEQIVVAIAHSVGLVFRSSWLGHILPALGQMALKQIGPLARHFEWLRPIWARILLSSICPGANVQRPVDAVRAIAAAMKPSTSHVLLREPAHDYLDQLSEAADVPYHPPAFLQRLIDLMDMEAPPTGGQTPVEVNTARELLLSLRKNARTTHQELDAFVRGLIRDRKERTLPIARAYGVPVAFAMVHERELADIKTLRQERGRTAEYTKAEPPPSSPPVPPAKSGAQDASPIRCAHHADLIGLALSGGGIRSATFNLGVLQALAQFNLLRHCDYLSTVSGGGYIGSWFAAWMHRLGVAMRSKSADPISVEAITDSMRVRLTPSRTPNTLDGRVRPIRYLREFSNYLTPKTGFFSADSWTMIAIILRNTLLNLTVLIPLLAAILLVPRLVICVTAALHDKGTRALLIPGVLVVVLVISVLALILNLRRARPPRHAADKLRDRGALHDHAYVGVPFYARQGGVQLLVVIPLLITAWLTVTSLWIWLNPATILSDGRLLVHWRSGWQLSLAQTVLPHGPAGAAIAALFAAVVVMVWMSLQTSGTCPWSRRERRKAFAIAWSLAPAGGAIFALALTQLKKIVLAEAGLFGAFQEEPFRSTVAGLFAVGIVAAAVPAVGFRWKQGRLGVVPFWVIAAGRASIMGIVAAGVLWMLGLFIPVLETLSTPGIITRLWPQEPIRSAAVWAAWIFFVFLFIFVVSRGFFHCWPFWWHALGALGIAITGSTLVAFGLFWVVGKILMALPGVDGFWHAVALGPSLVLATFSIVIAFQLGLLGSNFPDEQREWWSRLRAWTLIYSLGWCFLFTVALYPPVWKERLLAQAAGEWGSAGAVLLWLLSTLAGVKAAGTAEIEEKKAREPQSDPVTSAATKRVPGSARLRKLVVSAAPYVFIAGLLIAISIGIQAILDYNIPEQKGHWHYPTRYILLAIVALAVTSVLVSWRIGVNEFSMHHFYKNRLVRCYLGASHWRERKPDWFTGFDSGDDIRLKELDRHLAPEGARYAGPYPILNAALNLVAGEDLAWQERKATSFIFTPAYCGYDVDRAVMSDSIEGDWPDAYAPTTHYVRPGEGLMLGTAMAISGAAANPNMGKVTSAATAFLMTVFNVRLGWWLPNPRRRKYRKYSSPRLGLTYTAVELFGMTDDKRRYINVSDGGHFENLGVYELIRRGCRYIIASDAGQDGAFALEDLGNLVRKCRTDFGVEIELGLDRIRNRNGDGWSDAHCVVGKIHYLGVPRRDAQGRILFENGRPLHEEGLLLYLKPSITGDEPFDVLEYYKRVPEFPHESTADQWFNESQFESYRRLGFHIAENAFGRYLNDQGTNNPGQLFEELYKLWHPPSQKVRQHSTEHAIGYSRLTDLLRSRQNLTHLDAELFEDIERSGLKMQTRDEFNICNELIQLIENVYADLDLEQNYAHPHVEGWMAIFRRWADQPAFKRTWRLTEETYAERFRNFYSERLANRNGDG